MRLGDRVLVGASRGLEGFLQRRAVRVDGMERAGAVERLVFAGAGGVDGHTGFAQGAQPGEVAERHAPLGVPVADRLQDPDPRFLVEVVALAAGQVHGGGDAAHHRLIQGEQPGLGRPIAALGGADQPPLPGRRPRRGPATAHGSGRYEQD